MALIDCNECGKQISDKAVACLNCGAPVSGATSDRKSPQETKDQIAAKVDVLATPVKKSKTSQIAWATLVLLAIAAIWYSESPTYKDSRKPLLPIEMVSRKAILGPGLVVGIKNNTSRHLSLVGTFRNPTLDRERSFRIDLSPNATKEIGHLEGWTFASGDQIEVRHDEYATWHGKLL